MRILVALLLAGSAVLPAPANGYTIDEDGNGHRLHWRQSDLPVLYRLARGNVAAGEAGEAGVHRAARSWSAVSDNFAFRFGGFVERPGWGHDGRNTAVWFDREWPFDDTMIATTVRTYRRYDGHMVDADFLFNAESYRWAVGGADDLDVENAVVHELGHGAGLGHSSDGGATMFGTTDPGETSKRTLEDDDRQALTAVYGSAALRAADDGSATSAGGSLGAEGGGGGGCSVSLRASDDDRGLLWIAALLVFLALRSTGHRREVPDEPSMRPLDRRRAPRVAPVRLEGVAVELGSERLHAALIDVSVSGLRLRLRARSPSELLALEKMVSRRRSVEIDLPGIGVKTAIPTWHVRERRGWISAGFRMQVSRATARAAPEAAPDADPSEAARRAFLLHLQGRR
ncbi:MAG: matrixin family metalloprotease, partial [Candidatus Binatia bacterium]